MNYADQPAFPLSVGKHDAAGELYYETFGGLSKREHIATQLYSVYLDKSSKKVTSLWGRLMLFIGINYREYIYFNADNCAQCAVEAADILISELNKPTNNKP